MMTSKSRPQQLLEAINSSAWLSLGPSAPRVLQPAPMHAPCDSESYLPTVTATSYLTLKWKTTDLSFPSSGIVPRAMTGLLQVFCSSQMSLQACAPFALFTVITQ